MAGRSIFQQAFDAYSYMVERPYYLFLNIITFLTVLATSNGSLTPNQLMSNLILSNPPQSDFLKTIAEFFIIFITFIIRNEPMILLVSLLYIPAFIKNDFSTWMMSFVYSLVFLFLNISPWRLFVFAQCYYIYSFVDSLFYKFLIFFLSFIIIIVGYTAFVDMIGVGALSF